MARGIVVRRQLNVVAVYLGGHQHWLTRGSFGALDEGEITGGAVNDGYFDAENIARLFNVMQIGKYACHFGLRCSPASAG